MERYPSVERVLALIALILCLAQAFGVHTGTVQIGWVGLAFLCSAFVV